MWFYDDIMLKPIILQKRVVRASKVTETGIYAPMTSSGRIIVSPIDTYPTVIENCISQANTDRAL